MKFKKLLLIVIFSLFIVQPVFAQGLFSDIPCFGKGDCGLCDFVYLFLKLAHWGLGVMGALALLAFVFGGVLWLTSGGSAGQIAQGKKILTGTIMGIIIILSAYLIVNFVISAFTGQWGKLYIKGNQLKQWYDVCEIKVQKK